MLAVDTNVLVRLLTGDDPKQFSAATSLLMAESIWIAKTVLLETDWVLRSGYGFNQAAIREAFNKLLGLNSVHAEDSAAIAAALALAAKGMDFADALHLSSRPAGVGFASFDQAFVRTAQKLGVSGVAAA